MTTLQTQKLENTIRDNLKVVVVVTSFDSAKPVFTNLSLVTSSGGIPQSS
jgi:hypothetical protein